MCLNCGYEYTTAEGFCSELCQNDFTEQAEASESQEEEVADVA